MKILIVEDDDAILDGLTFCLKKEGFEIIPTEYAKKGIEIALEEKVDLLILDINLPDINGLQLYRMIKEKKDIPTIFLTANDSELSIVEALDSGADDYITKPFKTRELISRVHSVLRRSKREEQSIIEIKDIVINLTEAKVYKKGNLIFLTTLEYKILLIFFMHPNWVFTREEILANIWDTDQEYVNDNTLTVYIKRIREKIEDDPTNPKIILTVRGVGYRVDHEK